ncbi:MAG: hypothetical protein HQK74_06520 [Desulfamplus sp.]|nr:hypothetical protein [Desulfamplus sp.]
MSFKYSRKLKLFENSSDYSKSSADKAGTAMSVALHLQNIFDEEYIASVNASDDSRAGVTSYYVGAPFTTILSVSFEY